MRLSRDTIDGEPSEASRVFNRFKGELLPDDADVLLVDIREPNETEQEIIEGALLAPRGMLEFYADPSTPYHLEEFERDRRIVLYCSAGSRSALGAQTLQEIGYSNVAHLDGGIKGWKEAGYPVEVRHDH